MKREQLIAMKLDEAQIGEIMALHGADIERHKNEAAGLRARLSETEQQLGALEGAQGEAEGWRERFHQLEEQTAGQTVRRAVEQAAGALRFSSKSARRAFEQALLERALPVGEGGFSENEYNEFLSAYRGGDPSAFEADALTPRFVGPTPGTGLPATNPHAQANDALRMLFRRD